LTIAPRSSISVLFLAAGVLAMIAAGFVALIVCVGEISPATGSALLSYYVPAIGLIYIGLIVVVLRDDTRRWHRRLSGRCVDCGYPLRGLRHEMGEPRRCPECGRTEP
jgi:hypothetical protein